MRKKRHKKRMPKRSLYRKRQGLWEAIGICLSVFGTGLALGTQFDTEILPILVKGFISCVCVFAGNSMLLYLSLGREEEASHV